MVGVDTDLDALRFAGHNTGGLAAKTDVALVRGDVRHLR